jgi:hypothetical protein
MEEIRSTDEQADLHLLCGLARAMMYFILGTGCQRMVNNRRFQGWHPQCSTLSCALGDKFRGDDDRRWTA